MIEVWGLSKSFGDHRAVNGVSFEVKRGEILSLLGPNGAGKTTIMRILTGYLSPSAGHVKLAGKDLTKNPQIVRQQLGYLPEHASLYSEMRIEEYLEYRAAIKGVRQRSKRIDQVLEICALRDVRRRIIFQLSKGYRQRVSLAAVLLHAPPVLILDEPTVGLDPNQIREIRALVRNLGRENSILFSTHILPEAEAVSDRVLILQAGRVVLDGPVATLAQKTGRTRLELDLIGEAEQALAALNTLGEGLKTETIATEPSLQILVSRLHGDIDYALRASISKKLLEAGLGLVGMRLRGDSLEEAFSSLTAQERDLS